MSNSGLLLLGIAMAWAVALGAEEPLPKGRMPDAPVRSVEPVGEKLREEFQLAEFYTKCVSADGFPIVASAKVSDAALLEAAYLIDLMLQGRDDIRRALIASKTRFAVMAPSEMTTEIPEHSDLKPARWWDRRARGLGATDIRPAVSCGEENLLGLQGDPYASESILIHEFAHAIHQMGLSRVDPAFDGRLKLTYERAMNAGLWKGKYAASNHHEYFAEAVQSWYSTNRQPDHDHNHVDTPEELKEYDPQVAALVEEIFGPPTWKYLKPQLRQDRRHLATFAFENAPAFSWPEGLNDWYNAFERRKREASEARAADES
jgi:alpha-glucosidase